MSNVRLLIAGLLLLALPHSASALEYRSTGRAALLYDAPSATAGKVAIAGSGLPLEVVVDTDAWVKVRDHSGRLAWIEKSALSGRKSVMIKSETSAIRQQPRADADVVFHAVRGVLLEATGEVDAYGWLPVKHADGLAGWVPAHEVWGR
ncbi:MAG: SH3 domain-containing protein [Thiobacillus sp.]|uniref:SH3 domain-containing protein n=1 Tax=Thiobacillus sp. TaxID=924 RepID=UPI002893EF6F|nr:SH3 domain-containing protein [Thiobacillus sp.]MDT3705670.1 SH3 domain-containing protein [Thiobacillus sp.]